MKSHPPAFEGLDIAATSLKLTGKTGVRVGALDMGEPVYLMVKAYITRIGHADEGGLFTRSHDAKTADIAIVDADTGARMLDEALALSDERFGIRSLFRQPQAD
jgi:hypothetical protein